MKIKSLTFLSNYRQFKKGQSFVFSGNKKLLTERENNIISVIVGRNGSGKTTLMSLIPTLFHHIERYNGKIPADFELVYSIEHSKKQIEVKISHYSNLIRVTVPNRFENIQLVPRRNPSSNDYSIINKSEPFIEYYMFHEYTPMSVVTSTFSLHGEYPFTRPNNYNGYQIVSNHTITSIYGRNHYEIGSISRGILRFIKLFFESKNEIKELLSLFDLKFTNRILHKYRGEDPNWMNVNQEWLRKKDSEIQNEEAYLNDIEFERYGRNICLSNMSSGEKMLLLRAITILNSIENNSIVIIEEPELHLDQVWNRQLTTLFNVLFSKYKSHIVIATHDYAIINSVPFDNLILLREGNIQDIKENTFLASYDELFRILYGDKFKKNKIEEDFINRISQKSKEELEYDFNELGNSIYKYLVFKQIKKLS
jgi:ABC-type multidrug transport system ATPase subunit